MAGIKLWTCRLHNKFEARIPEPGGSVFADILTYRMTLRRVASARFVCLVIISSDGKGRCQHQKVHSFHQLFVFLWCLFYPRLANLSTFSVVSHFHVRAERRSPPLSSVISLLWLNSSCLTCPFFSLFLLLVSPFCIDYAQRLSNLQFLFISILTLFIYIP